MKSRTRSTRRWKNRLPELRQWCRPWNACANWCGPLPRVRRNSPPLRIRCRRCRAGCWTRWTVFPCNRRTGTVRQRGMPPRGLTKVISSMSQESHVVGFKVGHETYGIPIAVLHEIVRVPEITAVPDAPEHVEGVINLRGKIVAVGDMRKGFGKN